jgi:hypothetical protein
VTVSTDAPPPPPADTTAPVVSLAASGTSGTDGWFSSNVTVRASAEDAVDYLTTVSTRVGSGAWTATPNVRYADVSVTTEGTTTVAATAEDSAGNVSAEVTRTVKVDKTAPVATAALNPAPTEPISLATNTPEKLEVLESADAIYTCSSRGGGLKQIQLERFLETVGCDRTTGTNQFATLNLPR